MQWRQANANELTCSANLNLSVKCVELHSSIIKKTRNRYSKFSVKYTVPTSPELLNYNSKTLMIYFLAYPYHYLLF